MNEKVLGDNPLQRHSRDSIWNIPSGEETEETAESETEQTEDALEFTNPLENKNLDETVFPETAEETNADVSSPPPPVSGETASASETTEESGDFFEIPDFPEEPLRAEEQEQLSSPEAASLSDEDLSVAVEGDSDAPEEEEAAERDTTEETVAESPLPQGDPSGYEERSVTMGAVEVKELSPLMSSGSIYQKLNTEPHLAESLAKELTQKASSPAASSGAESEATISFPEETATSHADDGFPFVDASGLLTIDDLPPAGGGMPGGGMYGGGGRNKSAFASLPGELEGCLLSSPEGLPPSGGGGSEAPAKLIDVPPPSSPEMITGDNAEEEDPRLKDIDSYDDILQLVGFQLEDEMYGVDIMSVQEIIRPQMVTPVPRVESFVIGVLNLRGKVMPIIDLRRRFSLPSVPMTTNTRIIIAQLDSGVMGFVVDSVTEVIRLKKNAIESGTTTTTNINSKYIKGIGHLGEDGSELLILLDMNQIVSKQEQEITELLS